MIEVMPETNEMPRKSRRTLYLFFFFVLVLAVLIYSSFFADISFTGNLISEGTPSEGIPINAVLNSAPNISLNGEFSGVSIKGLVGSFLYVGNQKLPMNDSSRVFITGYSGALSFDEGTIFKLNGKASRVSLNGAPILPSSGETLKVYIQEPFEYSTIDISEGASIKKINYITSGKIIYGDEKSVVNLNEDSVLIGNFFGGIKLDNGKLSLDGFFETLETKGTHEISISA